MPNSVLLNSVSVPFILLLKDLIKTASQIKNLISTTSSLLRGRYTLSLLLSDLVWIRSLTSIKGKAESLDDEYFVGCHKVLLQNFYIFF